MKFNSTWLFEFVSYTECQGTIDKSVDYRLLNFTLPCDKFEAIEHLKKVLERERVNYDEDSIISLTRKISNS